MRLRLVSAFLADSTQQIHSLRARDVMSSQVNSALGSSLSPRCRSSGTSWMTPPGILLSLVI